METEMNEEKCSSSRICWKTSQVL